MSLPFLPGNSFDRKVNIFEILNKIENKLRNVDQSRSVKTSIICRIILTQTAAFRWWWAKESQALAECHWQAKTWDPETQCIQKV